MKYIKFILLIGIIVSSCKSKKITTESSIAALSTKKVINNHYSNTFDKRTVYAKLNAKYRDKKTSAGVTIKLRMEKDKTIWMSATKLGFPLAKLKITPSKVSYYEKLQKVYFEGDFSLLSKWLKTDLDFDKVQNILLGQAVLNLRKGRYISSVEGGTYQIKPKKEEELFHILFLLNPNNFKLSKQEIKHPQKKQVVSVSYPNYSEIKGEQFPKNIDIKAVDASNLTTINIEYRSVEFDRDLTFPFSIPKGYKEITLK